MLRKARKFDVNTLAKIHFLELNSDFLPSLGERFLRLLYLNLLQSKNTCIFINYINNDEQGFAVGTKDFNKVFMIIIMRNFIKYVFLILPQIIKKPKILKNIFDTMFYTKKAEFDAPRAELIVIAVSKKYHRKGIGRQLIFAIERNFLRQGIKEYKVSVNAKNSIANSFYLSLGFKKTHDFLIYGKKINLYIKQIQ